MSAVVEAEVVKVKLDDLVLAAEVQIRTRVNKKTVSDYVDMMEAGVKFPPIKVVIDDQDRHLIANGAHRYTAAKERGLKSIEAIYVDCNPAEAVRVALEIACEENVSHGLPLTRADKRHAIAKIIRMDENAPASDRKSNRAISKLLSVSSGLVEEVRKEINTPVEDEDDKPSRAPRKVSHPEPQTIEESLGDSETERLKSLSKWVQEGHISFSHIITLFKTNRLTPTMIPNAPFQVRVFREGEEGAKLLNCIDFKMGRDGGEYVMHIMIPPKE